MEPGKLYWSRVRPVWDSISIYKAPKVFLAQFSAAPEVARILFAAHWCQSEVCNGGLHQFFCNSTGVLAPEAVAAFRQIGMPQIAEVVEEAKSWFGPAYPRDRGLRNRQLDRNKSDPFRDLDARFFRLIGSEAGGFVHAADSFAEAHPD